MAETNEAVDRVFKLLLTHVTGEDAFDNKGWCTESQWLEWAQMEGMPEDHAKAFFKTHATPGRLSPEVNLQYDFSNKYVHYLETGPITDEDRDRIRELMKQAGIPH